MYADSVNVINDGVVNGVGSVFYSLADTTDIPKIDYFGYMWNEPRSISSIAYFQGCLEEFGGWLTIINIQYLNENGKWVDVGEYASIPALPETDIVFFQPHFTEWVFEFAPVKTYAIRILGDTKVQSHWNKPTTRHTSAFTSITELSIYEAE
jgi:hypothetical protein